MRLRKFFTERPYLWIAGGWALTTGLAFRLMQMPGLFEPDRLFHFALLREMSQQGVFVLRTWNQVPLLGWNEYFSDKEWLFHFLLLPGWKLAGETGVFLGAAFFTASVVWLPVALLRNARAATALAGLTLLFGNIHFLPRMSYLRPHVLGVALFAGLAAALVSGRRGAAALCALGFALAYHAFYMPLALAALAFGVNRYLRKDREEKAALFAALGVAVGLIVNPYFPSNFIRSAQTLALAVNLSRLPDYVRARIGVELLPVSPWQFTTTFLPILLLLAGALWLGRRRRELWPIAALAVPLWVAGFFSPRTLEFVLPLSFLSIGYAIYARPRLGLPALGAVILANAAVLYQHGGYMLRYDRDMPSREQYETFLGHIPVAEKPTMVFHERWDLASFTIYLRPDLQVPEVLDPTYLWLRDPPRAQLMGYLWLGGVEKSAEAIRKVFGAEYVLATGPLKLRLDKDAAAERLTAAEGFALYRLKP